jgi:hypothetical protein
MTIGEEATDMIANQLSSPCVEHGGLFGGIDMSGASPWSSTGKPRVPLGGYLTVTGFLTGADEQSPITAPQRLVQQPEPRHVFDNYKVHPGPPYWSPPV